MTEDNIAPRPSRPGNARPGPVSPSRRRIGGRGASAASPHRVTVPAAVATAAGLNALASSGRLAATAAHSPREHALLGSAVYAVAWPIVFSRVTRAVEMQRGHRGCMSSVRALAPECLDGFEDDVAAVVDYVLRFADTPITNLEGWIASRVQQACVDGHRRRRGQRGALQRPRLPEFVAARLGGDPWLCFLAVAVLTWVGLPMTAGCGLWPLEEWGRCRETHVPGADAGDGLAVERDVETVLNAMRARPAWFERYVEGPLGRKQTPVYPTADVTPPALRIVDTHEFDDAVLVRLAGLALDDARRRLAAGQQASEAVAAAIGGTFVEACAAWGADRPPHQDPLPADRIAALLRNPAEIDRLASAVLDIVALEQSAIEVAVAA